MNDKRTHKMEFNKRNAAHKRTHTSFKHCLAVVGCFFNFSLLPWTEHCLHRQVCSATKVAAAQCWAGNPPFAWFQRLQKVSTVCVCAFKYTCMFICVCSVCMCVRLLSWLLSWLKLPAMPFIQRTHTHTCTYVHSHSSWDSWRWQRRQRCR